MRWSERVEEALGVPAWSTDEANLVLDMARDVAHGTERRFAPLTAYAIGLAVGRAQAEGDGDRQGLTADMVAAIQQAVQEAAADAEV